ncbi:hypothetical protein Sjap_020354 [Stephania japonica]|uniref:Uncharacterized protein n=1 Tax=Stephania japonica TaxID=461633 RepID=A0AAP0F383_9MAGN
MDERLSWLAYLLIAIIFSSAILVFLGWTERFSGYGAYGLAFNAVAVSFLLGFRFVAVLVLVGIILNAVMEPGGGGANAQPRLLMKWNQVLEKIGIQIALLSYLLYSYYASGMEAICFYKNQAILNCIIGAAIGHYACCAGVAMASAVGTTGVMGNLTKATNGGVLTLDESVVAAVGGGFIGVVFSFITFATSRCTFVADFKQLVIVPIALVAGLVGFVTYAILVKAIKSQIPNQAIGNAQSLWTRIFINYRCAHLLSEVLTAGESNSSKLEAEDEDYEKKSKTKTIKEKTYD